MKPSNQKIPMIRLIGMSCACLFTLIGVLKGLAPEVILFRVGVGTVIVMGVSWAALRAVLAIGS